MLTASGTEENLLAAIRGGAAGYLLKSEPPERIAEFLRGVAEGQAALSGEVARRLLEQVREGGVGRGVPETIAASLSARELEVLLLLDEHLGTDEIAARLYISEHTVRSHVKSLLRKLTSPRAARRWTRSPRPAPPSPANPPPWGMRFTQAPGGPSPILRAAPLLECRSAVALCFLGKTAGPRAGRCHSRNPSSAAPTSAGSVRGS